MRLAARVPRSSCVPWGGGGVSCGSEAGVLQNKGVLVFQRQLWCLGHAEVWGGPEGLGGSVGLFVGPSFPTSQWRLSQEQGEARPDAFRSVKRRVGY